jgi:hypothetical protein
MRDGVPAAIFALVISAVGAEFALGLCAEFPFEDQVRSANLIFVGTLRVADATWTADHKTIVTRYQFGQIRYVKGSGPEEELLLMQAGGRVGNTEIIPSLRVTFQEGSRYVVFASIEKGSYVPQACGWSPFGVWTDSGSATPIVHLGNGGPILSLGMRHVIALRNRSWETDYPSDGQYPRVFNEVTKTCDLPEYLTRPPRRSFSEILRSADSLDEATSQGWNFAEPERRKYLDRIKLVLLWRHQDLRTRVTESDFIAWLEQVCLAQSSMLADSVQSR